MAYSEMTLRADGYVVPDDEFNQLILNDQAIRAGAVATAGQAQHALLKADSATALTTVTVPARGAVLYAGASGAPGWLAAGTDGYVLTANGAGVDPAWEQFVGVTSVARDVAAATVLDTTTETHVLGTTGVTIPANTLSTNKMIRGTVLASVENTTGGNLGITVRVKYGGTTFAAPATTIGTSDGALLVRFHLSALNATNAQVCLCELIANNSNADLTGGDGGPGAIGQVRLTVHASGAVDSTTDQTLAITVQHSVNTSTTRTIVYAVQLELV